MVLASTNRHCYMPINKGKQNIAITCHMQIECLKTESDKQQRKKSFQSISPWVNIMQNKFSLSWHHLNENVCGEITNRARLMQGLRGVYTDRMRRGGIRWAELSRVSGRAAKGTLRVRNTDEQRWWVRLGEIKDEEEDVCLISDVKMLLQAWLSF